MKAASLTAQQWANVDSHAARITRAIQRLGHDAKVELWPGEDGRTHLVVIAYCKDHTRTWKTNDDTRPTYQWATGNPDRIAKTIVKECGGMKQYPLTWQP